MTKHDLLVRRCHETDLTECFRRCHFESAAQAERKGHKSLFVYQLETAGITESDALRIYENRAHAGKIFEILMTINLDEVNLRWVCNHLFGR